MPKPWLPHSRVSYTFIDGIIMWLDMLGEKKDTSINMENINTILPFIDLSQTS